VDEQKRLNGLAVAVVDEGDRAVMIERVWFGFVLAAFAVMPGAAWLKQDFRIDGFLVLLPAAAAGLFS